MTQEEANKMILDMWSKEKLAEEWVREHLKYNELKEENERLKEYYDLMVQFNQKNLDRFCDYKTRCKKAIEYINKHFEDDLGIICKIIDEHTCDANYNFLEDLIDILEGNNEYSK